MLTSEVENMTADRLIIAAKKGLKALYIVRYSSDSIERTTDWEIRVAF